MARQLIDLILDTALGLVVLFVCAAIIILPYFNQAYNTVVTGLSSTTTQGLFLIVLVVALIGLARKFMTKT